MGGHKSSTASVTIHYYGAPVSIHELSTGSIAIFLDGQTVICEDYDTFVEMVRYLCEYKERINGENQIQ